MATLESNPIKASAGRCANYINNVEKTIPLQDISNALNYINGDHTGMKERVYTNGHAGISCNQQVAMEQFAMQRNLYYQQKGSSKEQGCGTFYYTVPEYKNKFGKEPAPDMICEDGMVKVEKTPTIAEHIYCSFTEKDSSRITHQELVGMVDELVERTVLRDFGAISNIHYNTSHTHAHILANAYSKDGTKKLSLSKHARYELRKEWDYICAEHGYSIIEDKALLRDPVYRSWFEQVKAEGKVEIIPQNGASYNNHCTQKGSYKRHLDKIAEEEAALTEKQLQQKKNRELYYSDNKRFRMSDNPNKYYIVRVYTPDGRKRSNLELFCMLCAVVIGKEIERHNTTSYLRTDKSGKQYLQYSDGQRLYIQPAKELQAFYDATAYGQANCLYDFQSVRDRLEIIGAQMNICKTAKKGYETTVNESSALYAALCEYERLRVKVEGDHTDCTEEERADYNLAYQFLAQHKCTTEEERADFRRRYEFAKKKIPEVDARLRDLRKSYAQTKDLETFLLKSYETVNAVISASVEIQKQKAQEKADTHNITVDEIIGNAVPRSEVSSNLQRAKEEQRNYE